MDKSRVVETFYPEFDSIFKDFKFKFWVTSEYEPAGRDWDTEESFAGLNKVYRIILQEDYEIPDSLINRIKNIPIIEDARKLLIHEEELPEFQVAVQTSLESQNLYNLIYLPYAKLFTNGVPEIKVAVLDTGVNLFHQELLGKMINGFDFVNLEGLNTTDFIGDKTGYDDVPEDEIGHGTHVSGIIAAKGLKMDEGVCPGCSIMPVRVLATLKNNGRLVGAGIIDNINAGLKWAVDNGADVINMSLGIKHLGGGLPHEDIIKYALSKNVTIVAASGNDGTSEKYYPGALPGVIAVGAVDSEGEVTSFTSYGANISVIAPGVRIYSSYVNNTYAYASGTSQASPFVAGAVALMKSYALEKGKKLSNEHIRYILKSTSDKIDSRLRNEKAGYGLINLADAFKLLSYTTN
jgi:thermitase